MDNNKIHYINDTNYKKYSNDEFFLNERWLRRINLSKITLNMMNISIIKPYSKYI